MKFIVLENVITNIFNAVAENVFFSFEIESMEMDWMDFIAKFNFIIFFLTLFFFMKLHLQLQPSALSSSNLVKTAKSWPSVWTKESALLSRQWQEFTGTAGRTHFLGRVCVSVTCKENYLENLTWIFLYHCFILCTRCCYMLLLQSFCMIHVC